MATSHIDPHNTSNQLLEMTNSLIENFSSENLMTQSLDPTILTATSMTASIRESHPSTNNLYNDQSSIPIVQSSGPLITASKMMPVPESLMSPDCGPPAIIQQHRPISTLTSTNQTTTTNVRITRISQRPSSSPAAGKQPARSLKKPEKSSPSSSPRKLIANTNNSKIYQAVKQPTKQEVSTATTEDEDEDEMSAEKLKSIRKVAQKGQKQLENSFHQRNGENKEVERSALIIQKLWRGYSTRKKTMRNIAESLNQKRTQDYIIKLTKDMEMTKQALENERKIQQLQMQAIQQLWKKVSNMQTNAECATGENVNIVMGLGGQDIVQDLTKTCCMLTNQVRKLIFTVKPLFFVGDSKLEYLKLSYRTISKYSTTP